MNITPQNPQPQRVFGPQPIHEGIGLISQKILHKHNDPIGLALVGIHTGGDLLLRRIEGHLASLGAIADLSLDKGLVDIGFYRDDWTRLDQVPRLQSTNIPFSVDDRGIILIDDVIFTGRTVRAALEAIFSLGRPSFVDLAVLVDRGHREYPIVPDYVGLNLPTEKDHSVNVHLFEDRQNDHVTLEEFKYQSMD